MPTYASKLPSKISGIAKRFSWLYKPGATKAHTWYIHHGNDNNNAAIASTLMGTKNGEKTPTAISLASGGMCARIGTAIRSINPLGPGQNASSAMQIARPTTP